MAQSAQALNSEETKILAVSAKERWNPSQILLEKGVTYQITITEIPHWEDGGITPIDPTEGFMRWYLIPFEGLRRYPAAKWFVLIGSVGRNKQHFFPISQSPLSYTATATGEFFCFANDVWIAYDNNKGSLGLEIKCL
ncbi:MAG: hypothetical protein AAF327_17475 [Cyanobacteria bacterium P01_A01_bin.37]